MQSFPESINKGVGFLVQGFASTKNFVLVSFPIIEIVKLSNHKEVSIKLIFDSEIGGLEIQAPTVKYFSKMSHYDFKQKTEYRWIRDKTYLFSIVNNLKFCGLWDLVSNKDFLTVNPHNKRTDPKKLRKLLKDIL